MKLQETENQIKDKIDTVILAKKRSSQSLTAKADGPSNVSSAENRPPELQKSLSNSIVVKESENVNQEESKSTVEPITEEVKISQKVTEIKSEQNIISVGEALMDVQEQSEK